MNKRNDYFPMQESLLCEDYVVATYLLKVPKSDSSLKHAIEIAIDQTTGTWTPVPEETEEVKIGHRARTIEVHEISNTDSEDYKSCIIKIAFPHINFGPSLAMLFSTVISNNSSMGYIKLIDLTFPEKYVKNFKGCKFGVEGIRDILKIYDRPLLCNMIKPCTGIPPETGAKLAYKAAVGGADMIKDDELLADTEFSHIQERVSYFIKELKKADEIKGEKTLYMLNITDSPDKMVEHALRAIDAGANALMINYLTVGFDAVRMISENKNIQVPILGHCTMSGALSAAAYQGIDISLLLGKIPRMMGLDSVLVYTPGGRFLLEEDKYVQIVNELLQKFYDLKQVFPLPGGSIHPGTVEYLVNLTGKDCIISAGGGIHGHPYGPTAGAKAMRQAIELAMTDPSKRGEKEKEFKEFQVAIETWGKKTV